MSVGPDGIFRAERCWEHVGGTLLETRCLRRLPCKRHGMKTPERDTRRAYEPPRIVRTGDASLMPWARP